MSSWNRSRLLDRLIRGYAVGFYLFLFLPIVVVVVFSFNSGSHVTEMTGISLKWYSEAWTDPFVVRAFKTSLSIAFSSATISAVIGTAAAIALSSMPKWVQRGFTSLVNAAIVVPGIVLGLSLLIFVVTATGWLNSLVASIMPGTDFQLGLGYHAVVAGHSVFGIAIVHLLVRTRLASLDPRLVAASGDLYSPPLRTLVQVTLPLLAPAIGAGFLLAFTFSFDDFIIAFFTRGQEQTLPIFLFASIRRGVSPVVNATASTLLVVSVSMFAMATLLMRRRGGRRAAPT